jgi:hypothetical protein
LPQSVSQRLNKELEAQMEDDSISELLKLKEKRPNGKTSSGKLSQYHWDPREQTLYINYLVEKK